MPVAGSHAGFRKRSPTAAASGAPVVPVATPVPQYDKLDGDPNFMTSLARGLAVIQAFSQRSDNLRFRRSATKRDFRAPQCGVAFTRFRNWDLRAPRITGIFICGRVF